MSRGLGDVYKRQVLDNMLPPPYENGEASFRGLSSHGKGTQIYALLKSFAFHGGRDDASQYPNKNLANQVRKNLREYICALFGYSHSESPIEQESKNIYRVAFSISFSTGHVDEGQSRYVELF